MWPRLATMARMSRPASNSTLAPVRDAIAPGEANMSHSLANREHHHFNYAGFRRLGDVHVYFFGTPTLSFGEGVKTLPGDIFEAEAPPFPASPRDPLPDHQRVYAAIEAADPGAARDAMSDLLVLALEDMDLSAIN